MNFRLVFTDSRLNNDLSEFISICSSLAIVSRLGVNGRVTKLFGSIPADDVPVPLPYVYLYSRPGVMLYSSVIRIPKY